MLRAIFSGMDTPCYVQHYAQCHSAYQIFDVIGVRYRYRARENDIVLIGHDKRERGSHLPGKSVTRYYRVT